MNTDRNEALSAARFALAQLRYVLVEVEEGKATDAELARAWEGMVRNMAVVLPDSAERAG